jgi:hypothetical protein
MKKYIIERHVDGIGASSAADLRAGAKQSNAALAAVGPGVQWQQSYVVDDMTYCVYLAENEELIRAHAQQSGFPADRIQEVRGIFDPSTGHE